VLAEGEEYDNGVSVGRSKYLIFFPKFKRMVGLELKVTASSSTPTRFELRMTQIGENSDAIFRELYQERG